MQNNKIVMKIDKRKLQKAAHLHYIAELFEFFCKRF